VSKLTLKDGTEVEVLPQTAEMDACTGCELPVPVPAPGPDAPIEGQTSLCMACGTVNIFGPELRLREATDEELDQVVDEHGTDGPLGAAAYVQLERRRRS
jgi:hypothetical protein